MPSSTSSSNTSAPSSSDSPHFAPGSILKAGFGSVEIGCFIGRGSFGSVFSAQLLGCHVPSVIKVVPVKNDQDMGGRPSRAEHAQFQGFFFHENTLCFLMEKLGPSLDIYMQMNQYQPFDVQQVILCGSQLLTAVEFLHNTGIVHTDIKPANILLCNTENLQIKLGDLGSAMHKDNLPSHTDCLQTLNYMSPEVLLGLKLSNKMDIWSTGCVLVELYTGHMLFPVTSVHQLARYQFELFGLQDSAGEGVYTKNYFKDVAGKLYPLNDSDLLIIGVSLDPEEREMKLDAISDILDYGRSSHSLSNEDLFFAEVLEEILNTDENSRPDASECIGYEFFN